MRATLTIDDDVMEAAQSLAAREGKSLDEVVSEALRSSLDGPVKYETRNGVPLLPSRGRGRVTSEMVRELLDELP